MIAFKYLDGRPPHLFIYSFHEFQCFGLLTLLVRGGAHCAPPYEISLKIRLFGGQDPPISLTFPKYVQGESKKSGISKDMTITPLKSIRKGKSWCVLENSAHMLQDRHQTFQIWWKNG